MKTVIIELVERNTKTKDIEVLKQDFRQKISPLIELIENRGGFPLEDSWLNETLKVSIPEDLIEEIKSMDIVYNIGTPKQIQPE